MTREDNKGDVRELRALVAYWMTDSENTHRLRREAQAEIKRLKDAIQHAVHRAGPVTKGTSVSDFTRAAISDIFHELWLTAFVKGKNS